MDTCSNCGAKLRAGARFCTTCGTRLNASSPANDGWGKPDADTGSSTQETSVLNVVSPPQSDSPASTLSSNQRSAAGWTSAYGDAKPASGSASDPASRFISALDTEIKPTHQPENETPASDPESTWGAPALSFTPPAPSSWSYSGGTDETSDDTSGSWAAASTWSKPEPAPEESEAEFTEVVEAAEEPDLTPEPAEIDAAGFSDDGDDEVDYLSGDENIAVSGADVPLLPPDEARDRAIELVDELRRMVRMMSGGSTTEPGTVLSALTNASVNIGDFSDLRGVLAEVKADPRDIQLLARLAEKTDRIEALLDEHASLTTAIEDAIRQLAG